MSQGNFPAPLAPTELLPAGSLASSHICAWAAPKKVAATSHKSTILTRIPTNRRIHPVVLVIAVYNSTVAAKLHQKIYNFIDRGGNARGFRTGRNCRVHPQRRVFRGCAGMVSHPVYRPHFGAHLFPYYC